MGGFYKGASKKDGAKARARSREHAADDTLHTKRVSERQKPNHKAEHGDSGMIRAMSAHADEVHPVGTGGPRVSNYTAGDTADDY